MRDYASRDDRTTSHEATGSHGILLAVAVLLLGCSAADTPGRVAPDADQATSPPPAEAPPLVDVTDGPWPSDRDALVLLLENAMGAGKVWDDAGKAGPECWLEWRGRVWRDRHHAMVFGKGAFDLDGAGPQVCGAVRRSGAFSVEMYVAPAALDQKGPAWMLSLADADADTTNLLVGQDGDAIVASSQTGPNAAAASHIELFRLTDARPVHVVVTCVAGQVTGFKDGMRAGGGKIEGGPGLWSDAPLALGAGPEPGHEWAGTLEGVAVYARAMEQLEARTNAHRYAAKVLARTVAEEIEIDATLTARSPVPPVEQIAPYVRALVVYEYRVERLRSGACDEKNVRVAHWGMMDSKPLAIENVAEGAKRRMRLQRFDENPQLESECLSDTLPFDAERMVYYEVSPRPGDE